MRRIQHRSNSQLKQYEQCPLSYKLERIDKVWVRYAAWLGHGVADHSAIEAYELSGRTLSLDDAKEVFVDEYTKHINRAASETPNMSYWFSSGKYGGYEDVPRRFNIGLEMVERYYDWVEAHPEEKIWTTPDGNPAVELEFNVMLGDVLVKGFIDQVIVDGKGRLRVRDVKTGSTPGDTFQLALYALAIRKMYGVEITLGDYWMGKTGRPGKLHDLTKVSEEEIVERFREVDEGIKAEKFEARPGDHCFRCPVKTSCPFG